MRKFTSLLTLFGLLAILVICQSWTEKKESTLERVAVIATNGPAGKLGHFDISEKHQLLFMGNKMNESLDVFDIEARKMIQQLPGQKGISGVSYSPFADKPITGKGSTFNVFKFNEGKYEPAKSLEGRGSSKVRYSFYDHNFYGQKKIEDHAYITVYDSKTLEHVTDIQVPDGHYTNLSMAKKNPLMFLSGKDTIVVLDTDKKEVVNSFPITLAKVNKASVLDEENDRLFIVCRKPALFIVMNSKTGKEITSIPIKGDMDDLTFDEKRKRIYVPCGEGFISVIQQIDADHYELLENIPTGLRTRTDFFSLDQDLYFLSVERKGDMKGPEVWVYQPR